MLFLHRAREGHRARREGLQRGGFLAGQREHPQVGLPHERRGVVAPPVVHASRAVGENDDLARVISDKMRKLPGIVGSETVISFKVYSKKDLEQAWDIGLE